MATYVNDLARSTITAAAATPRTATTTYTGASVDLGSGEGALYGVQMTGAISGTGAALAGKFQESADNSSWTDITGATFTATTATDTVQAITFRRTQRYVRYIGTVSGSSPSILMSVVVGQGRKTL